MQFNIENKTLHIGKHLQVKITSEFYNHNSETRRICSHGIPDAENTSCNGENRCKSCDSGYHLENNACVINQCKCDNGIPTQGQDCITHNNHFCGSCDTGYHLNSDNQCESNVCSCDHGTAATGTNCPTHAAQKCTSCWNYREYHIQNDLCHRSHLKLSNGKSGYIMVGSETSSWNSVCDDKFEKVEAEVVCKQVIRQLGGFDGSPVYWGSKLKIEGLSLSIGIDADRDREIRDNLLATFTDPFVNKGRDTIMIDELACSGDESTIFDCPHHGLFQHDCTHNEDVWVVCSDGR